MTPSPARQTDQPSAAATEEALYYLRRYGSVREALSFLQRHSLYGRAVEESARAVPEHFHRALLLPAVRSGQLAALLAAMRAASASLAHWQVRAASASLSQWQVRARRSGSVKRLRCLEG